MRRVGGEPLRARFNLYGFRLPAGDYFSQQILGPNINRNFLAVASVGAGDTTAGLYFSFFPGPAVPTVLTTVIIGTNARAQFFRANLNQTNTLQFPGFDSSLMYVFKTVPTGYVTMTHVDATNEIRGFLIEGLTHE